MSVCAKDLMQRDVAVVEESASLSALEGCFAEAKVSGFPVVQSGQVVGVISRADVLAALAHDESGARSTFYAELPEPGSDRVTTSFAEVAARAGKSAAELRVEDLMTRSVICVGPDDSLQTLAKTLHEHRVHRALVVDAGQLVGIVSSLDLVGLIAAGELSG